MLRRLALPFAVLAAIVIAAPAMAQTPSADGDDRVSVQDYVRHDGGMDTGIAHCDNRASAPAGDDDPDDPDVDSNDGGSRRQGNEPYSVIDPTDPDTIVAGWNDYCLTDLAAGWEGFGFSRDGGETWTSSLVPGYPQDTSAEGMASPLFGDHTDAGDPIAAFDNTGRLFVGGIAFNRTGAINGDVFVSTYGAADQPNGYPVDYLRTRVVGRGTPSRNFVGIFQDKPMLEVDRTGGPTDGNVYVCWARFTGFGQNKIFFSRSTNHGQSFSRPVQLTVHGAVGSVQGCDIAIESDGDVYVTFRTFNDNSRPAVNGLAFTRSTDAGQSFPRARLIRSIVPYAPSDSGARDCGDGASHCPSDYVFHRVPLEPRVTADQSGDLPGVYLTYNEIRPGTAVPSDSSYSSAGGGTVGQSLVYVLRSTNNGRSWSDPIAVSANPVGHQYFPDVDALAGTLAVVWQDSRTDPAYSVQRPFGNVRDGQGRAVSSGENVINTFVASSTNGTSFGPAVKVSSVGHQPQYEMFGSRDVPFQGDYNWISLAEVAGDVVGYMTWTDNRDVVEGVDPRETEAEEGFVDGFDVLQCRVDLGEEEGDGTSGGPRSRNDAPYSGDNCGNAGGLDQNIYGISAEFD